MNAAPHTAGPWGTWGSRTIGQLSVTGPTAAAALVATAEIRRTAYANCSEVVTTSQKVVAVAIGETQEQVNANAFLIAAAPELLEALQRLIDQCDRLRLSGQQGTDAEKTALEVIAKATGAVT